MHLNAQVCFHRILDAVVKIDVDRSWVGRSAVGSQGALFFW